MNGLQCLLLTRDTQILSTIRPALEEGKVEVYQCTDLPSAIDLLERHHFDGLFIDCDDVPKAAELIQRVRSGHSNNLSAIIAMVNGRTKAGNAITQGANFVLTKPISRQSLDAYLNVALTFVNREFRRYFRYRVDLPVQITANERDFKATAVNVSEGGLGLKVNADAAIEGTVSLKFNLPELDNALLETKAEVMWKKDPGQLGVRFLYMSKASADPFHKWLQILATRK